MSELKSFTEKRSTGESLDTIWMDGTFVDWDEATVHVLTHGLHYGTGVFEGVRCYDTDEGPAIFRWDAHLDRLYGSAEAFDIEIPYTPGEVTKATRELIDRQHFDACYIRPIVFYGYDRLGVNPTGIPIRTAIAAWPFGTYLGDDALENGIDVTVSSWREFTASQVPTSAKMTGVYVNSVLAALEAQQDGYDEAILLTPDGSVAEGPGECLFLVIDNELYTPALSDGVLPSITRASVIQIAKDYGYTVHDESTISLDKLESADELFFAGTAAEITPISSINDIAVGNGTRGPVTDEIQSRFFDIVARRTDDYGDWFTPV